MTRLKSYDENAEECAYLLIRPDPRCPECTTIMDWRSTHREIAITNGAEIRLSDNLSVGRHLHMRDLRVAHHKKRVARQREQTERNRTFPPGGVARSCSSPSPSLPSSGRPHSPAAGVVCADDEIAVADEPHKYGVGQPTFG